MNYFTNKLIYHIISNRFKLDVDNRSRTRAFGSKFFKNVESNIFNIRVRYKIKSTL
jgi:hypothetical protein